MFRRFLVALVWMVLVVFLLFLVFISLLPHADAKDNDGDPSLCEHDWPSESRSFSKDAIRERLLVMSKCRRLTPEDIMELTVVPAETLAKWSRDLWDSGRIPRVLYGYTLDVVNDRGYDIDFNLENWNFTHSAYPLMWEAFSYKIPACSKMTMGFISPWAPEEQDAAINLMYRFQGKLGMEGAGRAFIMVPVWHHYYPKQSATISPLTSSEALSIGCKS